LEYALLYAELIGELKLKDVNLYVPQDAAPGAAPSNSVGMVFIWDIWRANICWKAPDFDELYQSALLWLQPLYQVLTESQNHRI